MGDFNNSSGCDKYGVFNRENFRFMKDYLLIKKWLNLDIKIVNYGESFAFIVLADQLERRLAEGFELIQSEHCSDNEWTTHEEILGGKNGRENIATHKCLAIGKQSIKPLTQAEAALELLKYIVDIYENTYDGDEEYATKAKKILEMSE